MSGGKYKLIYFNARARGDLIRWVLAYGGFDWEDCRLTWEDWPNVKPKMPYGQVPCLETPDGVQMTESLAICRYLAKKSGLVPADDFESYRCDLIVETVQGDMFEALKKKNPLLPPEQIAQGIEAFRTTAGPLYLGRLRDWLRASSTGYLVGGKLTLADLAVASIVENIANMPELKDVLGPYQELVQFSKKVQQERSGRLGDYLTSRPPIIATI